MVLAPSVGVVVADRSEVSIGVVVVVLPPVPAVVVGAGGSAVTTPSGTRAREGDTGLGGGMEGKATPAAGMGVRGWFSFDSCTPGNPAVEVADSGDDGPAGDITRRAGRKG